MEVKEYSDNGGNRLTVVKKYGKASGGAYFIAFIGALVYYWQTANTFSLVIMGFLKALVWPALLIYHLFKFLKIG